MPVLSFQRSDRHRVKVGDVSFRDRAQANLYLGLQWLEQAGTISNLEHHARIELHVLGVNGRAWVDTYTVPFSYVRDGQRILVDDNWDTDLSRLRKRLVKALLGLEVRDRVV